MVASRLRTSLETSLGLCAPASSNRRRRFTAALAVLTSISNSARRWAPRASRFLAFSVFHIRLARISQRICHYFIVRRPSLLVRADEVSNRMSGLAVVHMAGRLAIVRHRKPRSSLGAAAFR